MTRTVLRALGATLLLAASAAAQNNPEPAKKLTPADRLALADKVRAGFVVVEYTLQHDNNGEPPPFGDDYIRQERPLEFEGWLIGPDEVITRDLQIHPRFIKQIEVRKGSQVVPAKVVSYCTQDSGAWLKLDRPLNDAKPLAFKPDAKGPYYFADYSEIDGRWTVMVMPVESSAVVDSEGGRKYVTSNAIFSLVIDGNGDPVGLRMRAEFPLDESWKGSPKDWPVLSEVDLQKRTDRLAAVADAAMLRVKLHFRSPRKDQGRMSYDRESQATEYTVAGLLLGANRLMVMANMDPKLTARLERVVIHPVAGQPIEAKFDGTLTDYGCFLAATTQPMAGPFVKLSAGDIESFRNRLLLAVDLRLQGDQRIVYYLRDRLTRYTRGWMRRIYPAEHQGDFMFDPETAELICLPLAHREKVAVRERYGEGTMMMPAGYVAEVLAGDLAKACDPANVPLTEEQENRLAWLGVELQAMDAELARASKISDLTRNGSFGAIVSYVYKGSPADKAGVQPGWVLIRLHAPDQPKPIDVRLERFREYWERFPWDQLDRLPEEAFEDVPRPWPPLETSLIRSLTDLGFGKKVQIEFWTPAEDDGPGKIVTKDFVIEQSPPHFDTAPRHNAKDIGLTVRDMTYEVCRYFRKTDADPGVIISKVEPGSKASVAGIKPFELITAVNDQPVKNVKDFEKLLNETKGELRLNIKRMNRGRLVKIDLAAKQPARPTATPPSED